MSKASQITDIKDSVVDYLGEGMGVTVNINDKDQKVIAKGVDNPTTNPTHTLVLKTTSSVVINAVLTAIDNNSGSFPT
jgi:hypothetical protein